MLDPAGEPLPLSLPRAPAVIMIGPEGGWSDAERQCAAEAAAICHGLGRRVLRAETAPLAALAALRHGWGWGVDWGLGVTPQTPAPIPGIRIAGGCICDSQR
jgi:hypothetical protein